MVWPYVSGVRKIVTARRLVQVAAVALGLLVLATCAATVILDSVLHSAGTGGPVVEAVSIAAAAIPAATVGVLLAVRRPGNPIGWLLFVILTIGTSPTDEYDVWVFRQHHGSELLGRVSLAVQELWPFLLVAVAVLLWVFPDGKLPGGQWRRPSVVLLIAGLALAVAATVPGISAAASPVVRVGPDGNPAGASPPVFVAIYITVIAVSGIAWLTWLVTQFPTYRHAHGERRQQLKWLYSGGGVTLIAFVSAVFFVPLATGQSVGSGTNPLVLAFLVVAYGTLPVCLGVAVLKYRLYELDRIISRVVSYTLVTGLLVGVYAGLVLLATHVLPFHSAVAVAVSTLICAALFAPVRRRVQRAVDRRFNRSRYNAETVVAAFTAQLQHHVGLDVVQQNLINVVDQAFQPTQVAMSLIREPDPNRPNSGGRAG
jgi:small basic protein